MGLHRWLYTVPLRLRSLFRRDRVEQELNDELRFHVDKLTDEHVARGMTADAARLAALRALHGVEQRKEECRDARRVRLVEDIVKDLRYAVRLLRRTPAFTIVAVVSLALGIGATTAIFNLLDSVLLATLPVRAPRDLVLIAQHTDGPRPRLSFGTPAFDVLRTSQALEGLCAFRPWSGFRIATAAGAQLVTGQLVSGNCFSVLGLRPSLGRLLTPDDDRAGSHPVAVISHAFWRRHFGGDLSAIGRTFELQGRQVTVVGVTPRQFYGLEPGRAVEITVPLAPEAACSASPRRILQPIFSARACC